MNLRKIKFLLPFVILFVLLGMLYIQLSSSRSYTYAKGIIGDKMPEFSVPAIDGKGSVTTSSLRGRVTLLNFWASWCGACHAEHAMLMKIKNEYHIPIYGIAFKDNPNDAKAVLEKSGNPFAEVGYDATGATSIDFGVYGTPETYVISPSGNILYRQIGVIDQHTWDNTIYPLIKNYQ